VITYVASTIAACTRIHPSTHVLSARVAPVGSVHDRRSHSRVITRERRRQSHRVACSEQALFQSLMHTQSCAEVHDAARSAASFLIERSRDVASARPPARTYVAPAVNDAATRLECVAPSSPATWQSTTLRCWACSTTCNACNGLGFRWSRATRW
jgi:hypothetical protein